MGGEALKENNAVLRDENKPGDAARSLEESPCCAFMNASSEAEEARKRMQLKTFTTWANLYLKKVGLKVENILKDFADGIKLLKLVEVISEEKLGKYCAKPISKFQKVENLNIPLAYINAFIKDLGITNQYSAENILEEREVSILGMIWSLILRYSVSEISEGEKTAKEGMLLWAQKKSEESGGGEAGEGAKIKNFHTAWQDGTAFCSLIRAYRPDLISSEDVLEPTSNENKVHNLTTAFTIANDHLGIPIMLDAEDMVKHKPDEKSVMTYVSFFWKAFASTKRKELAAGTIGTAIARERHLAELEAQYEDHANGLLEWMKETKQRHETLDPSDSADLQATLDEYVEYGHTVKPARFTELMESETLHSSLTTRLEALNRKHVVSPEHSVDALKRWWEELMAAETVYEEKIKKALTNLKRIGQLISLYQSKTHKLETWLGGKAGWLQVSLEAVNAYKAALPPASPPPSPPPSPPDEGVPDDAFGGADDFGADERLEDLTLGAPPAFPGTAAPAARDDSPGLAIAASAAVAPHGGAPAEGAADTVGELPEPSESRGERTSGQGVSFADKRERGESVFDDLFSNITGTPPVPGHASATNLLGDSRGRARSNSGGAATLDLPPVKTRSRAGTMPSKGKGPPPPPWASPAAPAEDSPAAPAAEEAAAEEAAPSFAEAPASREPAVSSAAPYASPGAAGFNLTSAAGVRAFEAELASQRQRLEAGEAVNSESAVLAKLNMLKAHDDEFAGRKSQMPALTKLLAQLEALSCPRDKLYALKQTYADIEAGFERLAEAAETYRVDLIAALSRQKKLDEMRLSFATKAETLRNSIEDTIDLMTEVMIVSTPAEADAEQAALVELRGTLAAHGSDVSDLNVFHDEMLAAGAGTSNPYSRYTMADVHALMSRASTAADDRDASLDTERSKIAMIDAKKRQFAESAVEVLATIKAEREALDAIPFPGVIHPDDTDAIAQGNAAVAAFEAFGEGASERKSHLTVPQQLSDELMALAEVDNPYTHHTMPSLKAAGDQLERVLRDRASLVEGQLARAQTDITPEQHAELKAAFKHFDHSGDGRLNRMEFEAAIKSMDFEVGDAEMKSLFNKFSKMTVRKDSFGDDEDMLTVSFDGFLTFVLQQYKDKDTMEGLLMAFKTMANGKEALGNKDIDEFLKEGDAAFIRARVSTDEDGGYLYTPFVSSLYGTAKPVGVN